MGLLAAAFAFLTGLPLNTASAFEEGFYRGCRSTAEGLRKDAQNRYCACMDRSIASSGLSARSLEILRDFVTLEKAGAPRPVYSEEDKLSVAPLSQSYSTMLQFCFFAAAQYKLNDDGTVKK